MAINRTIKRGDGYINQRTAANGDVRYQARWHDGVKWRAKTFGSMDDAEDHLRSIGRSKRAGRYEPQTEMTVSQLVDDYIQRGRHRWTANTVATYTLLAKQQINPHLGKRRIVELTPAIVQRWLDRLTDTLSAAVVENARTVLSGACREAVRLGAISTNPVTDTRAPARKRVERETWSDADVVRVLAVTATDVRLHAMYMVALTTGVRPGELRALQWGDVDTTRGILNVRRSMTRTDAYKHIVGTNTKTGRARSIALPAVTLEALARCRTDQRKRQIASEHWVDRDLVFDRGDGNPVSQQTLSNWHRATCTAAKVTRIRMHDLRHSFATRALGAGVSPKVVADILGHSSVATTLDIYSHINVDMQRSAIDALADAMTTKQRA